MNMNAIGQSLNLVTCQSVSSVVSLINHVIAIAFMLRNKLVAHFAK